MAYDKHLFGAFLHQRVHILYTSPTLTQGAGDSATIAYVINSLVSGGSQNLEKAAAFGICCSLFAAPIIVIVKNVSERFFADVSF